MTTEPTGNPPFLVVTLSREDAAEIANILSNEAVVAAGGTYPPTSATLNQWADALDSAVKVKPVTVHLSTAASHVIAFVEDAT